MKKIKILKLFLNKKVFKEKPVQKHYKNLITQHRVNK